MANLIFSTYVLATSLALIAIKLGADKGFPLKLLGISLPFNINFYTVLGVLMYGISFVLYVYLLTKNDLGYIIPLTTAFVYIVIFIASFFIFKEAFTVTKIAGICLILGGVILLNINK